MLNASQKIILTKLKWFGYEKITTIFDLLLYSIRWSVKSKQSTKKNLVYVGEMLPPRVPRMAKWVKRSSDLNIILICHKRGYVKDFSDPSMDETFLFRNKWHLKRILRAIKNIYILHGFAPKSYYCNIARKAVKAPYVHDMQDVYSIYYDLNPSLNWLKKELPHEKECLENADGIVSQSMELNAAYRLFKTTRKPKTIFFPLYCDDDFFQNNSKSFDPENIHLVYAGGVAGSHRNPKQYGNIQFHNLISILTEQKIHFHIYPSPSNIPADYEEYEIISKTNSYFHFHKPVKQQELAKELARYDFGILPFFKGLSEQSELKLKYATTLKLFNYMESGIPIIVSKDLGYQSWIVEHYKSGFPIVRADIQTLKKKICDSDYARLKALIFDSRNTLSLKNNTSRLVNFYKCIAAQ